MPNRPHYLLAAAGFVAAIAAASLGLAKDNLSPDEWLQKMSHAIETLDYQGTVIRNDNGEIQPLLVFHKKVDGVVKERIVVQEGSGLEVIRTGDEVLCIVPDKKKVLIESWDNASSLFATLPSSEISPGSQYDVLLLSQDDRVAGRKAVKIAIRPIDSNRYEHRFWLDQDTGFPLRAEMIDLEGEVIEQTRFADISINKQIADNSLASSVNLGGYTWYTTPGTKKHETIESEWISDDLPRGFEVVSVGQEKLSGSELPVTHIRYGDGITTVSVFISDQPGRQQKSEVRGASSSYTTEIDGHRVTAVGEVPPGTVEAIATSMRLR